jgi:hypothetical protein
LRRAIALALLAAACKRSPENRPAPASREAVGTAPAAVPSVASSATAAAPKTWPPASTDAEALSLGRSAAARGSWDEAVFYLKSANDTNATPQVDAELGYAELMAGKLDDALESLEEARGAASTPLLSSQIEFNFGLVYEKRGDAEQARAAFARAYAAHPSSAAKAKLDGKSMCAASIERAPLIAGPGDGAPRTYLLTRSWRDAYAFAAERGSRYAATTHDWTIKPTSDARARELLCSDKDAPDAGPRFCADAPPWTIDVGHLMVRDQAIIVMPFGGGTILVVDAGMNGGGCVGTGARPNSTTTPTLDGPVLRVESAVEWFTEATCKTGNPRKTVTTDVYDTKKMQVVTIGAPVSQTGRTLTVKAKSCDPVPLDP